MKDVLSRAASRASADIVRFKADPWYAIKQGWVLTQDEKETGEMAVRPLPAEPHLEAVVRMMLGDKRGMLCKSRQLMMSWIVSWLLLHDAVANDARLEVFQGKKEDDVSARGWKGLLGRARFMRQHLPPWIRPEVTKEDTLLEAYSNGSALEAIAEGADVIRSRVPSKLFLDEMCFQQTGEKNWNAANPAADWMWGVSTPNGHEFLYRQADKGKSWDDWRKWPLYRESQPGLHTYMNSRGIRLAFLHYTASSKECTPEAQSKRHSGYTTERDFLREQEGSFSLPEGLPVWGEDFNPRIHVIPTYVPNPEAPLYRGWDFGYNGQAVGFYQLNNEAQVCYFDQVILKQVGLGKVCQEVLKRSANWLSGPTFTSRLDGKTFTTAPVTQDYGDPSAFSHHTDGTTDAAILSKHGIKLRSLTTTGKKQDLVENVRTHLAVRSDGKPNLVVALNSVEMESVVAMFEGGYHFPEQKEGRADKEIPHKDGFFDHIADQLQYFLYCLKPPRVISQAPRDKDWWRDKEAGVGSGYLD